MDTAEVNYEALITSWIEADATRYAALTLASDLRLNDWCLSAGFLRNLVWDNLHQKHKPTPLNDLDLVYFDPRNVSPEVDFALERQLKSRLALPWSVKNQARMHVQNDDHPYLSTADAMSYWPEVETAVGVKLTKDSKLAFVAPFGLDALFTRTITINPKRKKPEVFAKRLQSKHWLRIWPELCVILQ